MGYNKMKVAVGAFVILFVVNLLFVLLYIFDERGVFDQKYSYYFRSLSADPFTIGMPIKVSGFRIGYIDDIELNDDGSVKVSFLVGQENQKWLLQKSVVMVRKPLLGSVQIILYPAIGNELLADGARIELYESDDINELVYKLQPIVERVENIVTSVDKITSYLARNDSEVVTIVKNLATFSTSLARSSSVLTTITGDQNSTDALIQTIKSLPTLLENFNKISDEINREVIPNLNLFMNELNQMGSGINEEVLPQLNIFVQELNGVVKDVNSKLKRLDDLVDSVGSSDEDVNILKQEIKTGIAKSNRILEKVQNIFPLKSTKELELP